ncbi:hypothetical protein [Luteibacter sp.]|uniref:hypothetical protein n=1 Tax=Luteibacter sp. TaxID=1886636 RepID=UPI003F7E2645
MSFSYPAAPRPKATVFATLLVGAALCLAQPARAAEERGTPGGGVTTTPSASGWQYSSSAVSEAVARDMGPPRPWSGHDYHFSVTHGPTYPSTYMGATKDEAVRMNLTLRWW